MFYFVDLIILFSQFTAHVNVCVYRLFVPILEKGNCLEISQTVLINRAEDTKCERNSLCIATNKRKFDEENIQPPPSFIHVFKFVIKNYTH